MLHDSRGSARAWLAPRAGSHVHKNPAYAHVCTSNTACSHSVVMALVVGTSSVTTALHGGINMVEASKQGTRSPRRAGGGLDACADNGASGRRTARPKANNKRHGMAGSAEPIKGLPNQHSGYVHGRMHRIMVSIPPHSLPILLQKFSRTSGLWAAAGTPLVGPAQPLTSHDREAVLDDRMGGRSARCGRGPLTGKKRRQAQPVVTWMCAAPPTQRRSASGTATRRCSTQPTPGPDGATVHACRPALVANAQQRRGSAHQPEGHATTYPTRAAGEDGSGGRSKGCWLLC